MPNLQERRPPPVILVADDDAGTRQLIRVQLEGQGYDVMEATDGRSAISVAQAEPIDLALLDITMPGGDGYEVLRELRALPRTATTPVVFISARTPPSEAAKALGLGAHDYLRKPFDPAELLARVDAALRIKDLQDQMRRRSDDLEEASRTDSLTGLFNRRHLVDRLGAIGAAALRDGRAFCVLMLDVDHFKAVNDGWGHPAGDRVLQAVGASLQRSLRGADIAGRWGGEEFLIILPDTTHDEGLLVAERIRRSTALPLAPEHPDDDIALPPSITVSIGAASGTGIDYAAVVRRADAALYRAKAAGRNRVEGSPPLDAGPPLGPAGPPPPDVRPPRERTARAFDTEKRVDVVLSVLAGRDEEEAAGEFGVEPEMVRRWRQLFVDGGRDRLAGRPPAGTDEVRDRYLAVLAHDLMVPLTVIRGWASLLGSDRLRDEQRRDAPRLILEAVARMERMGRDIADSAAVALGRLRLSVGELDVVALLEAVRADVGDDRIVVRATGTGPATLVGDPDRLAQVLTNLLIAARSHGGNGLMEVTVARTEAEVSVRVTTRDRELDFEVARQLFEPWPLDRAATTPGIGLYVCRALVVAHGGLLGVQADGPVTTFWMRLPVGGPPEGDLVERKAP